MRFDDFMRAALYDPVHGYYRKKSFDTFGARGDFFTASQLQPLFGRIVASEIAAETRDLFPAGVPIYELGPGRGEMRSFLGPRYTGVEYGDEWPLRFDGFVFANEFFDALPVRAGVMLSGNLYELLVEDGSFVRGPELDQASKDYVARYWPHLEEGNRFEIAEESLEMIDKLANRMETGWVLIIDYGYRTPETRRFPEGTLMSYHRHTATPDVLASPGFRDITAHVPFDALIDRAEDRGLQATRFETLAELCLRAIGRNGGLLDGENVREQLKTLLFGMGETFRCLHLTKKRPRSLEA